MADFRDLKKDCVFSNERSRHVLHRICAAPPAFRPRNYLVKRTCDCLSQLFSQVAGWLAFHRATMLFSRHTFCALVLLLIAVGCTKKPQEKVALRTRITAAKTWQYCHSPNECFSPHILVIERGYFVTVFAGNRPQSTAVSTEALGGYLTALPMSAWPLGPVVGISPSDDVIDSKAIQKNLEQAQRICRSLGLDVQFRPGG